MVSQSNQNEDSPKVAVDIVRQELLPHIQLENFSELKRMGTTSSLRPRPIFIKFKSHQDCDDACTAKIRLKGSGITVSEFLTKRSYKLFLECCERFGVYNCWTHEGRIMVLYADAKRYTITCRADLYRIATSQLA
ncbi:unnamed protein product [Diatraea saccharalis]|uniref:Uncharacterized protein n=1 Tax=Diatraea saccharalis TaxID=40085 RepID=A0A9N9WII8_9NEOP|nr:unnamed protein product [Diatraea saccharalis]